MTEAEYINFATSKKKKVFKKSFHPKKVLAQVQKKSLKKVSPQKGAISESCDKLEKLYNYTMNQIHFTAETEDVQHKHVSVQGCHTKNHDHRD